MSIAVTALREKIRRKELYIVSIIGVLILLVFGTGTGSLSINGVAITDYKMLAPILVIVVNAVGCLLTLIMSLSTIPNEYERHTSHLVWIRGISQSRYHGELALANVFAGLISEGILFIAMLVFIITQGKADEAWRLIPAYLLVGINITIMALLTSVLTVVLPKFVAGSIAALVTFCGIFHGLLSTLKDMLGGFGGQLIKYILKVIPNLHNIQTQAGNVFGKANVDAHSIWTGLLIIYILVVCIMVAKKKEA